MNWQQLRRVGSAGAAEPGVAYDARAIRARLLAVAFAGVALSLAIVFGLRELGRHVLDVPHALPTLESKALLPTAIAPVVGNSFGFLMSFVVRPRRHSMFLFLVGAAIFLAVSSVIVASKLPGSANAGSLTTTVAVVVVPNLIVPALLLLVPRRPYG